MPRKYWISFSLLVLAHLLSACSGSPAVLPSDAELASDPSIPLTEVTLVVAPPTGTGSGTKISLMMLESIAGADVQTVQLPMSPTSDGRYEVKLTVPVGSLLTYRYIRQAPAEAVEVTSNFDPVDFRVVYVPGPARIEETIAGWSDTPFSGTTGRIIGKIISLESGRGLRELLVSAGGITTFTEADGTFRLDGLPEGIHHLTVFSPDGAFSPASQGALVAAGTTTPAELRVRSAQPIFVTFQLTVPEGLSPETVVRLAGNITTLGNRFSGLTGGIRVSVSHMPTMVKVDPQHYLAVLQLFAGTDLRYKYTLGDGLWNAERNPEGVLLTRQIILPQEDLVIRDTVSYWGNPDTPPVRFTVRVPQNTPADDQIALQIKHAQWYEPLPMWTLAPDTWTYDLYGPLESGTDIQYRYCRNLQCGSADDIDTAGLDASGRSLAYRGQPILIEDDVREWKWLGETPPAAAITAEVNTPRPEVLTGLELSPGYHPSWRNRLEASLAYIHTLGADSYILPLNWSWEFQNPFPLLSLDPSHSLFAFEVRDLIHRARTNGVEVILKAGISFPETDPQSWWQSSSRDPGWWQLWFEEYQQYTLTAADTAAESAVGMLIIGGDGIAPALPGGLLTNGDPSGVPADAEDRWRMLIQEIRARYAGRLIFELNLAEDIPIMPNFLDSVDAVYFHWQVPLTSETTGDVNLMTAGLVPMLDLLDLQTDRFNRPLWIGLEYASVRGGAAACPPAPDGSCRPIELFEAGQDVDPDLEIALGEQAEAINAVLLATYDRPNIQGFFLRGFNPSAVLWDKSSSTYGKPAEDVLRYWYPHLNLDS